MGTPEAAMIATRIDQRRTELGLTVVELAVNADIARSTLQRRLNGDGKPFDVAELARMSVALREPISAWTEGI
jgi:transcriptional regulator with XRE-family HTH domain